MDLNVLGWKGMNWNLTGTNSIGLDGTGLDGRRFHGMDWTARTESASDDWTGRHCTSLDWTVLVWA